MNPIQYCKYYASGARHDRAPSAARAVTKHLSVRILRVSNVRNRHGVSYRACRAFEGRLLDGEDLERPGRGVRFGRVDVQDAIAADLLGAV
jgi:hypothetical protein